MSPAVYTRTLDDVKSLVVVRGEYATLIALPRQPDLADLLDFASGCLATDDERQSLSDALGVYLGH